MNKAKKYRSEYMHTVATSLRLSEQVHGSGRLIAGDSWFAGVKNAVAHRKKGLHFIGDVKGGTAFFPKKTLKDWTPVTHGHFITYTAKFKGVRLYACGVRRGHKNIRCIISTCLTTLPAKNQTYVDWDQEGVRKVVTHPRCEMDYEFTQSQPATDVHNKLRQKGLAMEKSWVCKQWEQRCFATAEGILTTDSFLAFAQLTQQGRVKYQITQQNKFVKALAKQMLFNKWRSAEMAQRVHQRQVVLYHRQLQTLMSMNLPSSTYPLVQSPPPLPRVPIPNTNSTAAAATNVPATNVPVPQDDLGGSGGMRGGTDFRAADAFIAAAAAAAPTMHTTFHTYSRYGHSRADFKGGTQRWSKCCKTKTSYFCTDCGFDVPICNKDACRRMHTAAPAYRYTGPRKFRRTT